MARPQLPLSGSAFAYEHVCHLESDAGCLGGHYELVRSDRHAAGLSSGVVATATRADRIAEVMASVVERLGEMEEIEIGHALAPACGQVILDAIGEMLERQGDPKHRGYAERRERCVAMQPRGVIAAPAERLVRELEE